METMALVQELSTRLRYWEVAEIIGRKVVVTDLEDIETNIHQAFPDLLPLNSSLDRTYRFEGTIRKYGLLSLDFFVPDEALPPIKYTSGREVLKELGFVENPEAEQAYRNTAAIFRNPDELGDPLFLNDLLEDIAKGRTVFKLDLWTDEFPERPRVIPTRRRFSAPIPKNYWPHEFTIKRACFANSTLVWLHMYGWGISIL